MKRSMSTCLLAATLTLGSLIQTAPVFAEETSQTEAQSETGITLTRNEDSGCYFWKPPSYSHRSDIMTPEYYVFAGNLSEADMKDLIDEMDAEDALNEWGSSITFITPKNGETYSDADVESFETMISHAPIKNIKLIGIDDGAAFINNKIADHANYIAGMLLVNGTQEDGIEVDQAIPVYLVNPDDNSKAFYEKANAQESIASDLQKTIVGEDETLADAFANAYDQLFIRNYRSHNDLTEFYNLPALADRENTLEYNFELTNSPVFEDLDMTYNEMVHQSIDGLEGSDYAWFEYIPKAALEAEEKTVPLVVTLHGNQNDPRLQGDTTGWEELAAAENFMVVSPEYQTAEDHGYFTQEGNTEIYGKVEGMGDDGVINLIEMLETKYPQIDPSRIYVTGLSQGGALTSYLGLKYNNVFAAAASVSGVNSRHQAIEELQADYDGAKIPFMYLCGDHDFFQMIPVDGSSEHGTKDLFDFSIWEKDENTHIYSILTGYQKANGFETADMDMEADPYFGITPTETEDIELGGKTAHVSRLAQDGTTYMELVAIEDQAHWNNKAEAQYIWNFFKNYSRDTETGDLVVAATKAETSGPSTTTKSIYLAIGFAAIALLLFVPSRKKDQANKA
ncbi:alpha/beta hydrolase family esterase [Allobaculum sp. JKK-2023]|uniref:alpha/beta hydrolase family esterase n=1 Tax=Allobaculum sp. JKK-2023 TaxID=3108943 RepID=UPI002B056490|nr:PHB depolymerase family esterase [Allobaculum sp. JKK-2023]